MMESISGIALSVIGLIGFLALAWCGFTRCPKCRSWCLGERDCEERRREKE